MLLFCLSSYSQQKVDTIHTAKRATLFSAVLPGTGQIYNQSHKLPGMKNKLWWELPVIYGGLGFTIYLIDFNQGEYKKYREERLNRLDPLYMSKDIDLSKFSDSQLITLQEQYRTYRDYSIIATLAIYFLQIVEAKVEGHLMHFDISNDLSLDVRPFSRSGILNRQLFSASLVFSLK